MRNSPEKRPRKQRLEPEGFVAFAVNHFPGRSFRRSNATRWWYFETAVLKSLHSQNRCDDYQTAMEIRHRQGDRMTHENLPRLRRRKQR